MTSHLSQRGEFKLPSPSGYSLKLPSLATPLEEVFELRSLSVRHLSAELFASQVFFDFWRCLKIMHQQCHLTNTIARITMAQLCVTLKSDSWPHGYEFDFLLPHKVTWACMYLHSKL